MFERTDGRLQLDINSDLVNRYTYRQLCWERGNIHCVHPFKANAHNSSFKCKHMNVLQFSITIVILSVETGHMLLHGFVFVWVDVS